jgi:hypothetical protein
MRTELSPEDTFGSPHSVMTTTVAPALMAGIGIDFNRRDLGGLHVGLEYLWWEDAGGSLKGNLGGLRLKVGVSVPFSWPGER